MEHSLTPLFDRLKERKFGDVPQPLSLHLRPGTSQVSPKLTALSSGSKKKTTKRLLVRISGTALSESLPEISIASANMIQDLMKFKLQQAESFGHMGAIDEWSNLEMLIVDALEKREIKECVLSLLDLIETVDSSLEGVGPIPPLEDLRTVLEGFRDKHLAPSSSRQENSLTTKVTVLTITSCLLLTLVNAIRADRLELEDTRLSSVRLAERQALHNEKVDTLLKKNRSSAREILRLQAAGDEQEERLYAYVEMLRKQEQEIQALEDRMQAESEAMRKRDAHAASVSDMSLRELALLGEEDLLRHESQLTEALARIRIAREQAAVRREASAKREGSEDSRCVICLENSKEILLLPCSHLCCCSACALSLARDGGACCPLCRNIVQQTIRVYS